MTKEKVRAIRYYLFVDGKAKKEYIGTMVV